MLLMLYNLLNIVEKLMDRPSFLLEYGKCTLNTAGQVLEPPFVLEYDSVFSFFEDPNPGYKLFGTIVHSGFSPDSGHYYAYIKDAMGRWYCCNDSCVSLSTLQKVLSEKVYILFFSRTKQRPVSANTALTSNGVRAHDCNGYDTSKNSRVGHPEKIVHRKQVVEYPSNKDNSTTCKVEQVPSSPQMKLNGFGNSNTKILPANVNGEDIGHKQEPNDKNGNVKANGVKFPDCNHHDSSKDPVAAHPIKLMDTKQIVECPSKKDNSINSKVENVPSSPQRKMNGMGNSNTKILPATANGKIIVHKRESKDKNSIVKAAVRTEKSGNSVAVIGSNGITKSTSVDSHKSQAFPLANGNGNIQRISDRSLDADQLEGATRTLVPMGRETSYQELQNGNGTCPSNITSSKRKLHEKDMCILFSKDEQSQAKLEELKEGLRKEASLVLQSCGWSDEVQSFMSSRKKLCASRAVNSASNSSELNVRVGFMNVIHTSKRLLHSGLLRSEYLQKISCICSICSLRVGIMRVCSICRELAAGNSEQ
ncbi:unnamed protein product [Ilex paraguariensis]|uniref:ubiquitinyl hydrolase 1 n=1 Tax=Ilex paraguariensis TaxID=185542 RepID=A0ABC8S6I7_9AQUA